MHFKKIVNAILLFIIVELVLYYGFQWYFSGRLLDMIFGSGAGSDTAVQTGMSALKAYCTNRLYIEIAFLISITYLVFSFHEPAYTPKQENELFQKTLYDQLDARSKAYFDDLNPQEKERFYQEYEEQLWVKYRIDRTYYLSRIRKPHFSRLMRFSRKLLGWILAVFIGLQIFNIYTLNIPIIQSARLYTTSENQTSTSSDAMPEIEVQTSNDEAYTDDISEIENVIAQMPSFLLTRCKKIYIMDEDHYLLAGKELDMSDLSDSAAFSYSGDMSIRIRIVDKRWVANTYMHTIAHELSHIFDFSEGNPYTNPSGCSNSDEFLALYQDNPYSLSEYGATSQYEFFAEAGALYITEPETLKEKNQAVYQYFDQLYGPYLNA